MRGMIKHVVMWKLKESAEGADRATNARKMKALLEACRGLPGMIELEIAVATEGLEATADVVLYSAFDSKEALDAYQVSPKHVEAKGFIGAVREWRHVLDYEA